jgi:hypothetical protein
MGMVDDEEKEEEEKGTREWRRTTTEFSSIVLKCFYQSAAVSTNTLTAFCQQNTLLPTRQTCITLCMNVTWPTTPNNILDEDFSKNSHLIFR